jgi:tRNA(fMet)-specific endonuclease VapC
MIVADTDVLIDALRGREPTRTRVAAAIGSGALTTTAISAFELLCGARRDSECHAVNTLLASLEVLALDESAGRRAASVHADLTSRGESIGMGDCLIAGVCLQNGAGLLTRNRRHFERIDGLKLA